MTRHVHQDPLNCCWIPKAHLRWFRAVPRSDATASAAAFDWNQLMKAAGLDPSRWAAADPREVPTVAFDTRAAWTGSYPGAPQIQLRMEAAAWKGRLVSFQIVGPWPRGEASGNLPRLSGLGLLLLGVALLIALLHRRSGRGDLAGAMRLAAFGFVCSFVALINVAHHPANYSQFIALLGASLPAAAYGWILYMAIEPYVRRHWPQVLIGWSRALAGRFRDPVVCSHILVGVVVGLMVGTIETAMHWLADAPVRIEALSLHAIPIGAWAASLWQMPLVALFMVFVFVLFRLGLRRTWLAAIAAFIMLLSLRTFTSVDPTWVPVYLPLFLVLRFGLELTVAMRFGLLAFAAEAVTVTSMAGRYPVTSDFSLWYASRGRAAIGVFLVIAVWCFHHCARRAQTPESRPARRVKNGSQIPQFLLRQFLRTPGRYGRTTSGFAP